MVRRPVISLKRKLDLKAEVLLRNSLRSMLFFEVLFYLFQQLIRVNRFIQKLITTR